VKVQREIAQYGLIAHWGTLRALRNSKLSHYYRARMNRNRFVVMGVTGSGKTTVGTMLAQRLGVEFVEGDDYHSAENVCRMASGIALTDDDRADWLRALAARIAEAKAAGRGLVVTCSALKRSYRDILRAVDPDLTFVFLKGSESLIARRIEARQDHFMPGSLLDTQLATLEEPSPDETVVVCDISGTPQSIVQAVIGSDTK
jgi:gluconokinase